jgi:ATP-binding cassette subfamily C (CFTR/MRP) protein 1
MSPNSTDPVVALHSFGPSIAGNFDFSTLFEDSILSILPSTLLLLVLPFRLWSLHKEAPKVDISKPARLLYGNKLVCNRFSELALLSFLTYAIRPSLPSSQFFRG